MNHNIMRRFDIGIFESILYSECIYADVSCIFSVEYVLLKNRFKFME